MILFEKRERVSLSFLGFTSDDYRQLSRRSKEKGEKTIEMPVEFLTCDLLHAHGCHAGSIDFLSLMWGEISARCLYDYQNRRA